MIRFMAVFLAARSRPPPYRVDGATDNRTLKRPATSLDMFFTCTHVIHMPTMIQIRNVPDDLHRTLKSRAALAGMSLSDYLLAEVRLMIERPTLAELRSRLERRQSVSPNTSPAEAVRAERDRP
jgi:plasmid stability protein